MCSRRRGRVLVCALIAALSATGCGSKPVVIRQDFEPIPAAGSNARTRPDPEAWCVLHIDRVVDRRMDPATFGNVHRIVRAPEDPIAWIRDVVRELEKQGIDVTFRDEAERQRDLPTLDADVELLTVWVSGLATSMAAGAVFRFDYRRDATPLTNATYRGNETDMNWSSGTGEIQSVINRSVLSVLTQAGEDIRRLCLSDDTSG